jgi:hypothetical protein
MVPGDGIYLLSAMVLEDAELAHNHFALVIIGQIPQPGVAAEIKRDVPAEGRPAKLPPSSDLRRALARLSG